MFPQIDTPGDETDSQVSNGDGGGGDGGGGDDAFFFQLTSSLSINLISINQAVTQFRFLFFPC